tara:strand:- start:2233 stop:2772 length:540 start_codon:yes stop_codon:yes gene_type:complete
VIESFASESFLLCVVALIWIIQIINSLAGYRISQLGIIPRSKRGLVGIFISPFIHHGYTHVSANTVPLFILGLGVASYGFEYLVVVTLLITIIGGILVWLFARTASHSGASLLIFGYFGVNVYSFFDDPNWMSGIISLVTIFIYGGIIRGVLPAEKSVSWEGHLFGFLAGIGILYFNIV